MELHVRPARGADADVLARFSCGVALESEGRTLDERVVRQGVERVLRDTSMARYFVAECQGRLIGALFVTYEWSDWNAGWYWWIQGVYVETKHRRQGVYRQLHEAVLEAASKEGAIEVRLYVEDANEGARATYEHLGMRRLAYQVYGSGRLD